MAKFFGLIGYAQTVESEGSIWQETIIEKPYYGDTDRGGYKFTSSSDKENDDITVNNEISIVADTFAYQNSHLMRYVTYMGARWKITSVTLNYPRIRLTIGGVYNGPEPDEGSASGA